MSALQKSAIQARLSKLPHLPPLHASDQSLDNNGGLEGDYEDEGDEEDDALGDLVQRDSSTLDSFSMRPSQRRTAAQSQFTPLSASQYFDQAIQVYVPQSHLDFRVYYSPPTASDPDDPHGTVLVCHHGAGFSALSFACFAKHVANTSAGHLGVLAFDARSHGKSTPSNGQADSSSFVSGNSAQQNIDVPTDSTPSAAETDIDLSIETLTNDLVNLISTVYPGPAVSPAFVLVGHSMGGTVVVRACPILQEMKYKISGVTVLDVVEGSALEAMPIMHTLLQSRPQGFDSIEEAIEWHVSNHTIRNSESARTSVPSLFIPSPLSQPSEDGYDAATNKYKFVWRAPLHLTAPFWEGWFKGLSNQFLSVRTARMLVLAGTDRLDKTLMIGQMQGKFQLEVVPDVGHMLHEDNPDRLATLVVDFWKRNSRLRLPIKVKKVGEL